MKPKVKCEVRPYSAGSDKASVIAVEIYSKLPAINDDILVDGKVYTIHARVIAPVNDDRDCILFVSNSSLQC
ncbi:MAG TPA: hypothetical protein V6D12_04595 [Candidatus Obscuribacterales bacterium]